MNIDINNVTFSVNVNSLYDQVMQKMNQLSNIEIQFTRKYQNKLSNSQLHASMVFFLRNALFKIQQVFQDVKSYFIDLNLAFVYQLFRKIYLFVVTGYNFTAQAFSIALSQCKTQQTVKQKQILTRRQSVKTKFDPYKKMEQMEYYIKSIEIQQERLSRQIMEMYDKALQHKSIVQKMKPSTAIKQISQIKCNVETIINNAQSTFQEAYMQKYKQFKNYVTKLGKPDDIGQAFCYSMGHALKDKFMQGMTKVAFKIKEINKQQIVKVQTFDQQTQTDKLANLSTSKAKLTSKQQKKIVEKYVIQIQNLKKIQVSTAKQNAQNISKLKTLQQSHKQLSSNYESLKDMYATKTTQLDTLKIDSNWLLQQRQKTIQKQQNQIHKLRNYKTKVEMGVQTNFNIQKDQNKQIQTQAQYLIADVQSQVVKILKSTNQRFAHRLSNKETKIRQLQKQLKDSSTIKIQLTDAINNMCDQINMEHLKLQKSQEPTLTQLVKITSVIFDTYRADRNAKNLLMHTQLNQLNRCSIQQQQAENTQDNKDDYIKASLKARRRNAKGNILQQRSVLKKLSAFKQGNINQNSNTQNHQQFHRSIERRDSTVRFVNTEAQTQYINDRMVQALNYIQNCNSISIQTDQIISVKHIKTNNKAKIKFNQRQNQKTLVSSHSNRNEFHTQRPKTRQVFSLDKSQRSSRNSQNIKMLINQDSINQGNSIEKIQLQRQAKTANRNWRQKFKMIDGQNYNNNDSIQSKRKYKNQRQIFESIKFTQRNENNYSHNKLPGEQIKNLMQLNRQNQKINQQNNLFNEKQNKSNNLVKESAPNLLRNGKFKNNLFNSQQEGVESLFQIKRLFTLQNPIKKQQPKKLLESVRKIHKKDKTGYKQIVFSLLESANHKKMDQILSNILMDKSVTINQQLKEKINMLNSKQTPPL